MPQDAAPTVAVPAPEAPDFPADARTVAFGAREFAAGGVRTVRFTLQNAHHTVLHIRLATEIEWLSVAPTEIALGPGEHQAVVVRADTTRARAAVRAGAAPSGPIQLAYQRLYPATRGVAPSRIGSGTVYVSLPLATCPACKRALDDALAEDPPLPVLEVCPYCYERLRPCPVCGAPNSWLARRCHIDPAHVIRAALDWGVLGGSPAHTGFVEARAEAALARRWSSPSVPPSRRENALAWSAPVAAYGLVAGAAATTGGDAHLYAFDTRTGAPLWEPYPLADPVYPDRGGPALAGGRLFAATVEGVCVAVDALRGTRLWETHAGGRVYGAVVPVAADGPLLVPVATKEGGGCLLLLDAMNGTLLRQIPLLGPPDSAPAFADGLIFAHDDSGGLTAAAIETGEVRWRADCSAGFDAAPLVRDGQVFSATSAGVVWCHDAATGKEVWRVEVTNAPFSGTPATDGTLLYLPADDGLHLVSEAAGRAVRRYPTRLPVRSAPIVAGGTVFFGAADGNVYGAAPGRPLEKLYETGTTGSQIVAAPAFGDGCLFVAATNGVLYALAHQPPQEAPAGAR